MKLSSKSKDIAAILAFIIPLACAAVYAGFRIWANSYSLTLPPNQFVGEARQAYQVAHDHPDLLAQLQCYCGCKFEAGHKNLLDCFRTDHGSRCSTCIHEALTAKAMFDQGAPANQIRGVLLARYGHVAQPSTFTQPRSSATP